ncbi:uncharacterized protein LOC103038221 isoform X2 [Astyanax mexicanus]|uniref:uncharacterized protein LOC103038221 isoform X2 n=1 Tax=Astyanax mexicanus TaxID=7994 RepID=UPI0020CAEB7B|nr:uncharacterized protein LOC103038221 isoform X2 [Astyanax mexicanus]
MSFLCCSCYWTGIKDCFNLEPDEENVSSTGGPGGSGENIHIVVEDLGVDNLSFILREVEDFSNLPAQKPQMSRSASSVSSFQRGLRKVKLAPLSSMPLQSRTRTQDSLTSDEYGSAVDYLLFRTSSSSDGGLLTPPVINLIPPTPSDVLDDDQFFDVNSEEDSVAHTSGSEGVDSVGSIATTDNVPKVDVEEAQEEDQKAEPEELDTLDPQNENPETSLKQRADISEEEKKNQKKFLRSSFQVPPCPILFPRKRSFNAGINLLQFTEHNLDDLSSKDSSNRDLLMTKLRLLTFRDNMDSILLQKATATRSCSLGGVPQSHTFRSVHHRAEDSSKNDGSLRQRRITVASYIPQPQDQNGKFEEHTNQNLIELRHKPLVEMNTEEVCQWFSSIGFQKCLPFIREAELTGSHITCIDLDLLDVLRVSGLEERERLLSAIYKELHPPNTTTQKLDILLETFGPNHIDRFTAALVSLTKSKSSPQINCLTTNQNSHKFRQKGQQFGAHRNTHLVEITIYALERIVHLRTPKDTSVGKVMESCLRMLGINEDKDQFSLKSKQDSSEEFSVEQQMGNLPGSETRLLELELCKKEKPSNSPESPEFCTLNTAENNVQIINQQIRDEKLQELNQQVDFLQNIILQVQELHQGLVVFCAELKSTDGQLDTETLDSLELQRRLSQAQNQLQEKRHHLQMLRDNTDITPVQKYRRAEVCLLERMRLNCQVFKEEITLVHLNRHIAHLHSALEEIHRKERAANQTASLGQLVSPQCPAMLVAVEESAGPDGRYTFTVCRVEGGGLQVENAGNSSLYLNDRLVEVNGVSVVWSSEEDLAALLQRPVSQLVILRQPASPPSVDQPQQPQPCQPSAVGGCQDGAEAQ